MDAEGRHDSAAAISPFPYGLVPAAPFDPKAPPEEIADAALGAAVQTRLLFRRADTRFGRLEAAGVQVLLAVWRCPGVTVKGLSHLLFLDYVTTQHALQRLREGCLIEAERDRRDRRWQRQFLTTRGKREARRIARRLPNGLGDYEPPTPPEEE